MDNEIPRSLWKALNDMITSFSKKSFVEFARAEGLVFVSPSPTASNAAH